MTTPRRAREAPVIHVGARRVHRCQAVPPAVAGGQAHGGHLAGPVGGHTPASSSPRPAHGAGEPRCLQRVASVLPRGPAVVPACVRADAREPVAQRRPEPLTRLEGLRPFWSGLKVRLRQDQPARGGSCDEAETVFGRANYDGAAASGVGRAHWRSLLPGGHFRAELLSVAEGGRRPPRPPWLSREAYVPQNVSRTTSSGRGGAAKSTYSTWSS